MTDIGWIFDAGECPSDEELRERMTPEMLKRGEELIARLHDLRDTFTEDTGQTVYSSMMKPCPFCGGKAWIQTNNVFSDGWETRAVCSECHVSTSREWEGGKVTYIPTGEDITRLLAIEKTVKVWNRRV